MLRVLTDHHDTTLALDDLALLTNGLDRRSYFHVVCLLYDLLLQVMRPLVRS